MTDHDDLERIKDKPSKALVIANDIRYRAEVGSVKDKLLLPLVDAYLDLRRERDRLRGDVSQHKAMLDEYAKEIAELRGERDRLRGALAPLVTKCIELQMQDEPSLDLPEEDD